MRPLHAPARPRRRRPALLGAAALTTLAATAALAPPTGLADPTVVYTSEPAATAIFDGVAGVPGATDALRQAPTVPDPRWPPPRQLGKVDGTALSDLPTAEAMEAALRQNARSVSGGGVTTAISGGVGVDEIIPGQWTAAEADRLRTALAQLGPLADEVVFYASPALVAQVGRADPRQGLSGDLGALYAAVSSGGHLFLEGYTGNLAPLSREDMAADLTRWHQRFPAERREFLHVLIGPSAGTSQADVWSRIRSTPAGRAILANGPGAFGLNAQEGAEWLAAYRAFLAGPNASPPGGDVAVPTGGSVSVSLQDGPVRPGTSFTVDVERAGNVSVFLLASDGRRRGLASFGAPGTRTITLPDARRIEPGAYQLVVLVRGDGLEDRVVRRIQVGSGGPAAPSGPPPSAGAGGGGLTLSAGQLLINQRISQAAVRRLNAVQEWLDAGLVTGDLAGGGLGAASFAASVVAAPVPAHPLEAAAPRPITPAPAARRAGGARVQPSVAQLRINQRISAAAVRRANALEARLEEGLTGGDIVDGTITLGKLEAALGIAATSPAPPPAASVTRVAPAGAGGGNVRLTVGQLRINQRISQAAVRRANTLIARLEDGVDRGDIRPGSLTADDLEPALR